jgi:hypothetical protein
MRTVHQLCGLAAGVALLFGGAAGCQNDLPIRNVEKPPPPDMQALIDAYAAPTATLGASTIGDLASALTARIQSADQLVLDQRLADAAREALQQLARSTQTTTTVAAPQTLREADDLQASAQALTIKGAGYLVVTRICDGWGTLPVPDLGNGISQLTIGFDEQQVDPVIWGTLSMCRYRVGEHLIQLDGASPDRAAGDVRAYIGPGITLANAASLPNPILIEVNARATVDGVAVMGSFSARIALATRALELLVPLPSGNVIVAVDAVRSNVVSVRAANGTFSCDYRALRCSDPSGAQLGAP